MQWVTNNGSVITLKPDGTLRIDNPENPKGEKEFSLTECGYETRMLLTETHDYFVQIMFLDGTCLNCGLYGNATYAASLMVALMQRARVEH